MTISPNLLAELQATEGELVKKLDANTAQALELEKKSYDEKAFRFAFNEDAMATEKTAEGIRKFAADIEKLEAWVAAKLA